MSFDPAPQARAVVLFDVLQTLALLLLTAVLLPALLFKRTIIRTRTWISFISCSIVFCISYLVLPLAGIGEHSTEPPPHGLCLFQACLVYAAPVLVGFAIASFAAEVHIMIHLALRGKKFENRTVKLVLLILPPLMYILVFALSLGAGLNEPNTISLDSTHMYCHNSSGNLAMLVMILVIIALASVIVNAVAAWIRVCHSWRRYRDLSHTGYNPGHVSYSLTILVRIGIFCLLGVLAISLCSTALVSDSSRLIVWNLMLPMLPIIVALTFGTQQDILDAWKFWRWRRK